MDRQSIYAKWRSNVKDADLLDQLMAMAGPEIDDAFYRDLEFGTGGLRGIMGAGTNRMNIYMINKATQGLADFLNSQTQSPSVAIAYDNRCHSERFAGSAAEVLAANGIAVHVFSELMPTPVLSFAVRALKCDAGIMITASHNPAGYNGYKVYGSDGCQITLDMAEAIRTFIAAVDPFTGIKSEPLAETVSRDRIRTIPQSLLAGFLDRVQQCAINPEVLKESDLRVIYSPLNGTGNKPVRQILARAGLRHVMVVPEQENPDGHFTTCQKPNPEEYAAFARAIELAGRYPADLLLATDPDCDRIGVAVRNGLDYVLLTGNEIGCLLLDYILSQKKAKNLLPENPVIIKTIVTSAMANRIAEEYGARIVDTLTGFKYIGEQIGLLESTERENSFILGFEESCGYLPGSFVRDKDAVSAALLICEMAAYYRQRQTSLLDELQILYERHGFWKHKLLSFAFAGSDGMRQMNRIMDNFRQGLYRDYAGLPIIRTDDYLSNADHQRLALPKSDVLLFALGEDCEIAIRPSGTEPKLKCYLTARSKRNNDAIHLLKALEIDLTSKIMS